MSIMHVLEMAALLIELFLASDEGWPLKVNRMLEMRGEVEHCRITWQQRALFSS